VRRLPLLLVALAATATAACGAPDELSHEEGVQLELSRNRTIAALATEERLSASPAAADRIVARVRKIVASGSLEPKQLDEFGLAALGELRLSAPSLVIVDRQEVPRQLDRRALTTFLAQAKTDPAAATKPAAATEVANIEQTISNADPSPGPDTQIPVVDMTTDVYLADLADRLRPTWPDLAADLTSLRSDL
jgi:hypothetical protein